MLPSLFRLLAVLVAASMSAGAIVKDKNQKTTQKIRKAPDDEVVGETDDGKPIVRKGAAVDYDSSEYWRQGKRLSGVAEMGLGIGGIPTSGAAVGYYFNSRTLAELSYVSGSEDILFIKVKGTLAEARLKRFWGNSFYANLGVGYRTIAFDATLKPLTGTDDFGASAKVSSIGGSLGIGNRWQWETFTMGCDWVGYFIPAISNGSTTVNVSGADESDKKDFDDETRRLGHAPSSQLLRFYLGVSF
jgi:hypothetical protein